MLISDWFLTLYRRFSCPDSGRLSIIFTKIMWDPPSIANNREVLACWLFRSCFFAWHRSEWFFNIVGHLRRSQLLWLPCYNVLTLIMVVVDGESMIGGRRTDQIWIWDWTLLTLSIRWLPRDHPLSCSGTEVLTCEYIIHNILSAWMECTSHPGWLPGRRYNTAQDGATQCADIVEENAGSPFMSYK